jgi:hypothetical protein
MGDPTSSHATAGIALRVSGALKPHHHDKVETPSVGECSVTHDKSVVKKLKHYRYRCSLKILYLAFY